MIELNKIYNEDCLEGMKRIPDKTVNAIVTDPPYLYLKHKLDREWDEDAVFEQWNRILKDDGFIVIFGRGISFYRWNTKLSELGFKFKEEIIWNKRYSTSSVLPIQRMHETISILTKNGKVRKNKIPYLEIKQYQLDRMQNDLKRLVSALGNKKSFSELKSFVDDRVENWENAPYKTKGGITISGGKGLDRSVITARSIIVGQDEQSIIEVPRDNRSQNIHETQKPVRLLERLMNLVTDKGDVVLDPFSGSASTAIACQNLNRNYIGFEIDKEYYDKSLERIKNNVTQLDLFEEAK